MVAGADLETALELATGPFLLAFRDDAGEAKVASRLVAEDDAARGWPRHEVRLSAKVTRNHVAHLPRDVRPLEDAELFDVGIAVAAAGELEVPVENGATVGEESFDVGVHLTSTAHTPRGRKEARYSDE